MGEKGIKASGGSGYRLRQGGRGDRSRLITFMHRALVELGAVDNWAQVTAAVDAHLAPDTPIWWVDQPAGEVSGPVACLWLGNAQDQRHGDRHGYVLLLYVDPAHRRCGLATALLDQAEAWAQQRGDRQIGLQVFPDNAAAMALYRQRGYDTASLWLAKSL
jgi:ribosomal protein S18 acetylase RimI-like enzyme